MSVNSMARNVYRFAKISRSLLQAKETQKVSLRATGIQTAFADKTFTHVHWDDSSEDKFPNIWLRDNCQCPKCFHPDTRSRLTLVASLDPDVVAKDVTVDGEEVVVTWDDNHTSRFTKDWLQKRAFRNDKFMERRKVTQRHEPKLWGSEYNIGSKTYAYEDVMASEDALLAWLTDLDVYGLTMVKDMPEGCLSNLTRRIGFSRETHYGIEFTVETKNKPNNLAYTSNTIDCHTDLPYYYRSPGVQFLHCIKQYEMAGGENDFADGFKVAQVMRDEHHEQWRLFTENKINYWDIGEDENGEFYKASHVPIFDKLTKTGDVRKINYNTQARDSYLPLAVEKVKPFYEAMTLFDRLLYDPRHRVSLKMKAGECVVFDNQRILHGRRGFEMKASGHRLLKGTYVDWEEIRSKINVIKHKKGII